MKFELTYNTQGKYTVDIPISEIYGAELTFAHIMGVLFDNVYVSENSVSFDICEPNTTDYQETVNYVNNMLNATEVLLYSA